MLQSDWSEWCFLTNLEVPFSTYIPRLLFPWIQIQLWTKTITGCDMFGLLQLPYPFRQVVLSVSYATVHVYG